MPIPVPPSFSEFLVSWVATQPDLTALLSGSGALRVSPWQAVRKDQGQRITYRLVSGDRVGSFGGPSGLMSQRWQVDCWGATPAEARQVARLVAGTKADRRLDGYAGQLAGLTVRAIFVKDERDSSESLGVASDVGNPCVSLDLEVWTVPN